MIDSTAVDFELNNVWRMVLIVSEPHICCVG